MKSKNLNEEEEPVVDPRNSEIDESDEFTEEEAKKKKIDKSNEILTLKELIE